jgi:hypothetical protein
VPQNYGLIPQSFLLVNDGRGSFRDGTEALPQLAKAGMITGAAWANINGDGKKELVLTGEWMTPKVFARNGGRFAEVKTNLGNLSGMCKVWPWPIWMATAAMTLY